MTLSPSKSASSLPPSPTISRNCAKAISKPQRIKQVVERTSKFRLLPSTATEPFLTTEVDPAAGFQSILTFDVVREAEQRLLGKALHKEYPPLDGDPSFNEATRRFLIGTNSHSIIQEDQVATAQTYGGIGALRMLAAFVEKFLPDKTVFLPDPCPALHKAVLSDARIAWKTYAYFDSKTQTLCFERMMNDLNEMPKGSFVLLHGCAHDPTGVDPTADQWNQVADLCVEKELLPFLDLSYQGLASGSLEQDAAVVKLFTEKGLEICVIQSYSKNLGLRNHRIGGLHFLLRDSRAAKCVQSQLVWIAAGMYAFPAIHGARIVTEILEDPALIKKWGQEIGQLHSDINYRRDSLVKHLIQHAPESDWTYLSQQKGLYMYMDLTPSQIGRLRRHHDLCIQENGRIPLVHLASCPTEAIAEAMVTVLRGEAS